VVSWSAEIKGHKNNSGLRFWAHNVHNSHKQAVCVTTQYAPTPCKLPISSYLFARWWRCSSKTISSYLFPRWHLLRHVGYLKHQQRVDLLTLKVVFESQATWATSVPILVFLGLSVFKLGPMYVTSDRQTDVRQKHRLMQGSCAGLEFKASLEKSLNFRKLKKTLNCCGKWKALKSLEFVYRESFNKTW